jgi:Amt family ammonium transporter
VRPVAPSSHPLARFFQLSFATTTATIDSGAVAERMKFVSYLALSAWMSAWTYPVVAHWVWSANGFLYKWQYVGESPAAVARARVRGHGRGREHSLVGADFAGSSVVHLVGGCSALVSAIWVGPRLNRFTPPNGEPRAATAAAALSPAPLTPPPPQPQ